MTEAQILRDIDAGKIELGKLDDVLSRELTPLLFRDPMLVRAEKDKLVLTDAGRSYLAAVDPINQPAVCCVRENQDTSDGRAR